MPINWNKERNRDSAPDILGGKSVNKSRSSRSVGAHSFLKEGEGGKRAHNSLSSNEPTKIPVHSHNDTYIVYAASCGSWERVVALTVQIR